MLIPVVYQCWGCGSEKVEYEEAYDKEPARTVWNLCPMCMRRQNGKVVADTEVALHLSRDEQATDTTAA